MRDTFSNLSGRTAIQTIISGLAIAAFLIFSHAMFFGGSEVGIPVNADTATTTVTVLNTPPNWTVDAYEYVESSTSTPTNVGSNVVWVGVGTDPNSEAYYLLLCKTSSTPTANAGAAPTCNGGAGSLWGVSIATASGVQATSTYTALVGDSEMNEWFAWICDGNAGGAQCNATYKNGNGTPTSSPFAVNHRPNFTALLNNGPTLPGVNILWTANASDTDVYGGQDLVQLFVCKTASFNGASCDGGTYCTSTASSSDPSCSFQIPVPTPDKNSSSYPYIIDNHSFAASGGAHGATSTYTISNAAPTISSSSVNLLNTSGPGDLVLTIPDGETTGFRVTLAVADNNSCQTSVGGNEVTTSTINVYRQGIGSSTCQTSGQYNANNCYPAAIGTATWNYFCSQDGGTCSGQDDTTALWTCTFPLWFLADPTDGANATDSVYFAEKWFTSVYATDNNGATSTLTESSAGNELDVFLAAILDTVSINYGPLSPGTGNPTLATSTRMSALGNVGLDQTLYGADMCTTYPSCPVSATSTIPVAQEEYASSTVAYGSGTDLLVNPGALFGIHIKKSTSTTLNSAGDTFWGIFIPGTIQLSGAYTGQNTFIAATSPAQTW
ncbi:MAG: hypothetical protein Q7S28_00145 [bacterium]|nr:hypothetical protein [bacterium]